VRSTLVAHCAHRYGRPHVGKGAHQLQQLALLEAALADGARSFSQVPALATEQGIPVPTLRRAKARLRVRSLRASGGRGQRYVARWVLPRPGPMSADDSPKRDARWPTLTRLNATKGERPRGMHSGIALASESASCARPGCPRPADAPICGVLVRRPGGS